MFSRPLIKEKQLLSSSLLMSANPARILALAILLVPVCRVLAQEVTPQPPASEPAPGPDLLAEAKHQIEKNQLDQAIQTLKTIQQQHPDMRDLQYQLGLAYYHKGNFVEAQSAFAKAMDADPKNREAVQLRGLSLFQLGHPAAAIPYLKQVQSWIGPANVDGTYVLGLSYMQTQKYDDA